MATERAFILYMANRRGTRLPQDDAFSEICSSVRVPIRALERWEASLKAVRQARRNKRKLPELSFARGLTLLRLRCFLQRAGFKIKELEGLTHDMRELLELIFVGQISLSYAAARLGYDESQHLVKVLVEKTELDKPRRILLSQLVSTLPDVDVGE